MSLDLCFWKYKKGEYLDNEDVYRRGIEGKITDGLENLPVDEIINAIFVEFDSWTRTENGQQYIFENGENGMFELMTTPQFIRAFCRDMNYEDMNRIVDIMHDFACPLYEPSLPQRFDTDIEI